MSGGLSRYPEGCHTSLANSCSALHLRDTEGPKVDQMIDQSRDFLIYDEKICRVCVPEPPRVEKAVMSKNQSMASISKIGLNLYGGDADIKKNFADITKMNGSVFKTKLRSEGMGARILGGGAMESRASCTQADPKLYYSDLANAAKRKTQKDLVKTVYVPSEVKISGLVNANNRTHSGIRGPGQSSGREKIWKSENLNSANLGNTSSWGIQGLSLISKPKNMKIFEKDRPGRKTLDSRSLMTTTQESANTPKLSHGHG
jgi:hypothetical protein